ncbi:MAG TPA: hypothetical protein IAA02_05920, partial [Candidatus Sutterella merdavium]|nr:hypothetical protein [Candidatus Sutterella merdavium]
RTNVPEVKKRVLVESCRNPKLAPSKGGSFEGVVHLFDEEHRHRPSQNPDGLEEKVSEKRKFGKKPTGKEGPRPPFSDLPKPATIPAFSGPPGDIPWMTTPSFAKFTSTS